MSRHEELIEKRSELLNTMVERQAASDKLLVGVDLVIAGGVEGIRLVAEQQPELIIETIVALVGIYRKSEESAVGFAESWFTAQDQLFEFGEMFDNLQNLIQSED